MVLKCTTWTTDKQRTRCTGMNLTQLFPIGPPPELHLMHTQRILPLVALLSRLWHSSALSENSFVKSHLMVFSPKSLASAVRVRFHPNVRDSILYRILMCFPWTRLCYKTDILGPSWRLCTCEVKTMKARSYTCEFSCNFAYKNLP